MRSLLSLVAALFVLCAGLVGAARALAPQAPPPGVAALLPDPACEAPCWAGLHPGTIEPASLRAWIEAPPAGWSVRPFRPQGTPVGFDNWEITLPGGPRFYLSLVRFETPYVDRLTLFAPTLRLGDVVAALGVPDFIGARTRPGLRGERQVELRLGYVPHALVAEVVLPLSETLIVDPGLPVEALVYEPPAGGIPAQAWRGFVPLDQYLPDAAIWWRGGR